MSTSSPAPAVAAPQTLTQWRTLVLRRILLAVLLLGTLAALPSSLLAVQQGLWSTVLIDLVALAWVVWLWQGGGLSLRARAWQFVALVYALGMWFLFTVGLVSQIYLLASPVLAALLLGRRAAIFALSVTTMSLPLVGYLAGLPVDVRGFPPNPLVQWLLIAANFGMINGVLTLSAAVLMEGLSRSLDAQQQVSDTLAEKQARLETTAEELRLTGAAVAHLNDIVLIIEAAPHPSGRRIMFANAAFERQTGYLLEEAIGETLYLFLGHETCREEMARITKALDEQTSLRTELIVYRKNGEPFWLELDLNPIYDTANRCTHFVLVQRDITDRKRAEENIHRLAFYDSLTGLPNRRLLIDRMDRALAAARRRGGFGAAIFLDLDHFKHVNDARGHGTGDTLLTAVAARLTVLLRDEDTIARLGGDEFVVLLNHLADDDTSAATLAMQLADKLRQALAEPFDLGAQRFSTGGSLGITLFPKPGQRTEDILREADMAMYRAKSEGRHRAVFFEGSMQAEIEERLTLQRDMEQALAEGGFQLYLQPQVNAEGRAIGAELLLRWQHPVRGFISPAQFIPIAEETGLIARIGDWILVEACHLLMILAATGRDLPLSVNVSPYQFHEADFVAKVRRVLDETGAPAQQLVLEVTEGLLIRNFSATVAKMEELASLGLRFSIDDFGTGYSSLAYLQRLPLDELKIDRSFLPQDPGIPSECAISALILSLARHMDLRVVAEGVETPEQAAFLIREGCHSMQGFLYARPMPVSDWLKLPDDHCYPDGKPLF
ncbi:bifunctional diguanylate cyclase/phosphodiesterase [Chitinimonas sp. BJYL2]|uniref:putative bifunctional diguanylate cyclase/phosphodiesterase n=1 Tax=Chitinimonas sp. BJYL2 TaxID=2976696 RepID=UPI0022B49543|nr:EAL domain-containing protein [Chitinimonas sp. BJYL2]